MCGVVALAGTKPVNQEIYEALSVLQHRGQDAAGIVTSDGHRVYSRTGRGLARNVFSGDDLFDMKGNTGIGHVRYPTAGANTESEAQPFYVNSPFGIALGHNGNLINAQQLTDTVFRDDFRQLNTTSDSEVMLNVFAFELSKIVRASGADLTPDHVFDAVTKVYERCRGAFAVTALIVGYGILAFRDSHGIRPLIYGKRETPDGVEYAVVSESVALDVLGFEIVRDVAPGEAVFIDSAGKVHTRTCADNTQNLPCIFEFVYLARPDSMIDNISVYKTRLRMGEFLGRRLLEQWPDHDIDVVIPVPDTSRTSALQLAHTIGVKYREGFIKNRYFDRTFIMSQQAERRYSVRHKLNAIRLEFENKNVLLVDDSIVRGTTAGQIVRRAREAGAKKVYFASAAPPVRYANVYGIDISTPAELVARNRTDEEISKEIGADYLIYQRINDLVTSVLSPTSNVSQFEMCVFDGKYITNDVSPKYLDELSRKRNDASRAASTISRLQFSAEQPDEKVQDYAT